MGGDKSRALNAVTMAVTGALGGQTDLQVAANTLAPYAANIIGEKFGHGEDKNTAAQMVSHAILGAALAYVNNGNPAAGGSAAVASEAAAGYLAERYNDGKTAINPKTGQFDPNLLPEDVKTQIRDLTAAIGAVVGGTVGDSAFNAQLAGVVGQNAVENNSFGVLTVDKQSFDKQKNNEYFQREFACKNNMQCLKTVLTENALDAMKYVPKEVTLNGKNYKLGDIISNPENDGSGLKYIVVNKNGVLKAEILPAADQVYYYVTHKQELSKSIEDMSFFSPGANSVLGIYGAATGQTLLSGTQLSTGQRVLSAIDGVSSVLPGIVFLKDAKVLSSDTIGMTWGKGINEQGKPWENYIQSTSPATTIDLNSIKSNFKAFDHFDPVTGLATSDKTLNTAAKTYQDPKKISSQINKYVDQMDNFVSDGRKGKFELENKDIKSKEMQLAVPSSTTKKQMDAIQKSIEYANSKGIKIKVTKVK